MRPERCALYSIVALIEPTQLIDKDDMGRNNNGVLFRRVASLSATRHHGVCGLVLTRCLDASPLGGGTGAMIRGLEDGLDQVSPR